MQLINKDRLLKKSVHSVFNPYTDTTDDYVWVDDIEKCPEVIIEELVQFFDEHKGLLRDVLDVYKIRAQEMIKKMLEDTENV